MNKYSIFDKMIEGVQIIDKSLRYIYVNDTVIAQSTFTKEELLGYTMAEKYPGIETSVMFTYLLKCMHEGTHHEMTNEFDFPDGSKGYFELRVQPIEEGVLILSFDVTKHKLAEQILKDTNTLLDEKVSRRTAELVAKNNELEQFVYITSHDLQEPLRTVSNYIELIKEDYGSKLDTTFTSYLNSVNKATEQMSRMMKAILRFSYIGVNKELKLVNFSALLNHILSDLELLIKSSGAIIAIGALPTLTIYEDEIQQLFQHLITNAIKFGKKGVAPKIDIHAVKLGNKWQFTVSDNGIGIAKIHHERIFNVFQRLHLHDAYEGNGIGLANCRKIVILHGGDIYVDSDLGAGSKFIFTLSKL